ncbi:MAG: DUF3108 domain-containing protein [Bacteroidaceae bacterium]|nr:DUF3108 domain-containing protein [Bacteroidaceae bacterium]
MNLSKRNFLCSLFSILCAVASAQSAFQPGEQLEYSLYYNWSFVWVKAGTATLTIKNSTYNGNAAYLTRLLMRGSKKADGYFVLRDTLTSYVKADNLQPLYYAKRDIEGKKRKKREVWYSYQGNNCRARQQYTHSSGRVTNKDETRSQQIYDMLSIMLKARNYDTSGWTKGKRINFLMTDGNGVEKQSLIYRGKTNVKMRDSKDTYRCLQLSFVEEDDGDEKEVITFFVTDDANHVPVRLDMYLKFGSAKVYLTQTKGLRNPIGAQIK